MVSPSPFHLSRLTRNYDLVAWTARLFLAGAFSAYSVELLGDFVQQNTHCSAGVQGMQVCNLGFLSTVQLFPLGIRLTFVILAPLIVSLLLTRRTPELLIVPPLYVQIITIGWFVVFELSRWNTLDPTTTFTFVMFLLGVGLAWDRGVIAIFGRAVDRNDIEVFRLSVKADVRAVEQILSPGEVRTTLDVSQRSVAIPHGTEIKSPNTMRYRTVIKLEQPDAEPSTTITVASYEVARYQIRRTPELLHYSLKSKAYLKELIRQSGKDVEEVPILDKFNEPILNETFQEIQGFYEQSKQMTRGDWASLLFIGAITVGSVVGILTGSILNGVILAIIDLLFALSELPRLVRRRGL